ncbi:MAG TPA: DUF1697 domain-containing protein [Pyrinomonadaceae bacterium]|nr:DUF1697 domain-containing protein [Pyrinomonadaceae bacterium]
MIKYAAFLRGINVGGHHIVKMADLRGLFGALDFAENVRTYIQSGNVIFETSGATNSVVFTAEIEKLLRQALGFEVRTMLRTFAELEEIAAQNPFKETDAAAGAKTYVTFLSAAPDAEAKNSLLAFASDFEAFRFGKRELYCRIRPGKPGKELFSNNFIEKHLKVAATTRNTATVNKVLLLQ